MQLTESINIAHTMDPYDEQISHQSPEHLTTRVRSTESHGWKTKKELLSNGMRCVFNYPEVGEAGLRSPLPVTGPQEVKVCEMFVHMCS